MSIFLLNKLQQYNARYLIESIFYYVRLWVVLQSSRYVILKKVGVGIANNK